MGSTGNGGGVGGGLDLSSPFTRGGKGGGGSEGRLHLRGGGGVGGEEGDRGEKRAKGCETGGDVCSITGASDGPGGGSGAGDTIEAAVDEDSASIR